MAQDQPATPPSTDATPERKEFSLKPIEQQMLQVLQDQYFSTLSNYLSYLCLERLAYQVTQATKFEIREGKLYVWEEATPEQPANAPVAGTPVGPAANHNPQGDNPNAASVA